MKLKRAFFLVVALVVLVSFTKAVSEVGKVNQSAQVGGSMPSQSVGRVFLVNPITSADVAELFDGMSINASELGLPSLSVRAETSPSSVGSVKFVLNQNSPVVRNTSPYVFGPANLTNGNNVLSITPYTLPRARGTAGQVKTINFSITNSPTGSVPETNTIISNTNTQNNNTSPTSNTVTGLAVTSFTLVNSETNQDIRTINNNDVIDVAQTGPNITIRANTTALPSLPGSVQFDLNGSSFVENVWPFTVNAGSGVDDYLTWNYSVGEEYVLTARAFEKPRRRGLAGEQMTVSFSVVNSQSQTPTDNEEEQTPVAPTTGRGADNSLVDANTVTLISPTGVGTSLAPGQTVNMQCDATVASGYMLTEVVFAWGQPGTNNAGSFYSANGLHLEYPDTFSQTQTVTVPTSFTPGQIIRFSCLAYYTPNPTPNGNTPLNTYNQPDDTFTIGQQSLGQTTAISIAAPVNNANVLSNQNFTITVNGTPTSDQISKVDFYYQDDLTFQPTLIGTDNTGPQFSLTHNFQGNRGYLCPRIFAKATLTNQTQLTSPNTNLVITDGAAQGSIVTCAESRTVTRITNPTPNSVFNAGANINVKVQNTYSTSPVQKVVLVHMGGNVPQNIAQGLPPWDITVVGTDTVAPYEFNYAINNPGFFGTILYTDVFKAYTYYANGLVSVSNVSVKITPPVSLPSISSAQIVNTSGTALATMTSGMTVNIGNQGGGFGPNIAIRANPSPSPAPGSVKFVIDEIDYERIENSAPYSSHGDSGGTYVAWPNIQPGAYTVIITPYTGANATGTAGTALTIPFVVVNNDDTDPPNPPGGVSVTYRSASEARITWSSSATATAYKVYRNNPAGEFAIGNVTTFIDNSINGNQNPSYVVTAFDSVGNESGFSTSAPTPALSPTFTIGDDIELNASASVRTTPDGTVQTPAQSAGSQGEITGGPIYYLGAWYWQVNFVNNPDGWVSEGLLDLYIPQLDTTAPSIPTSLSVTGTTASSISLDWSDSTDQGTPTSPPVSYKIFRSSSQNGTYTQIATSTTSSYSNSGLPSGATYWYKVSAYDSAAPQPKESDFSVVISGTTQTTPPPTDPVVDTSCPTTMPVLENNDRNASRYTVQLCAQVSESSNPKTITLRWATVSGRTVNSITIFRKNESGSWAQVATPSASATSWTDSNVTTGAYYEYKVQMGTSLGTVYGYIASGIKVAQEVYRGRLVLVIDNTKATGTNGSAPTGGTLSTQINNLIKELEGDKWVVTPIYVSQTATPASVRALIKGYYDTDANDGNSLTNTKAVYLFGHVPVPIIGNFNPDGHGNRGISSDYLYGEMTATWNTGSGVLSSAPYGVSENFSMPSTHTYNNPSPDALELQVGRVDMYDIPGLPGTENEKLVNYLTKASNFKKRVYVPSDSVYIRARTPYNASGIPGWNNMASVVGPQNVTHNRDTNDTWHNWNQNYLYVLGYGQSGDIDVTHTIYQPWLCTTTPSIPPISPACPSSNSLSNQVWGGVFNVLSSSYVVEWNDTNSILRAVLADDGKGLTMSYGANNHWYYHHMGMGKNIGYSSLSSINNTSSLYYPRGLDGSWVGAGNGNNPYGYMTLLGDPTLRAHYVGMPTGSLTVSNSGGSAAFSWGASSDSPLGYNVYEIQSNLIRKVNTSLITGTSYTSSDTYSSTKRYMVTAVKVRSGNSGTYYNESLGLVSGGTTPPSQPDELPPSVPANLSVSNPTTSSLSLNWDDSTDFGGGSVAQYKILRSSTQGGTYSEIGTSTTSDYVNSGLTASTTYWYKVSACDNASTPNCSSTTNMTPVSGTTLTQQSGGALNGLNGPVGPSLTENQTVSANPYGGIDYFVSCTGSDSNNGTSINTPLLTIDGTNGTGGIDSKSKPAGTRVFFKRGCTYYGQIDADHSGTASAPVTYDAYGTGTAPVISGGTLVTGWTVHSGNIYKATVATGLSPKYLFVGGTPQNLARHPNSGFFTTSNIQSGGVVTDSDNSWLSSQSANSLVGANFVGKTSPWSWNRRPITANSGTGFTAPGISTFASGSSQIVDAGWGYMFENKLSFLDQAGEWFYDSATGTVYLWAPNNANPNNLTVEISTTARGFDVGNAKTNIKVKNLVFEHQNERNIHISQPKAIVMENLELRKAPEGLNSTGLIGNPEADANILRNSYLHDIYVEGIRVSGRSVIEGNVVEDIAIDPQKAGSTSNWTLFGINTTTTGSHNTIKRNIVKNIGYIGIIGTASGEISENLIQDPLIITTDGGAMAIDNSNGLLIKKNTMFGGAGQLFAMPSIYGGYEPISKGFYFGDLNIQNTIVEENVIIGSTDGIWIDHNTQYQGNQVKNNIVYGADEIGIGLTDYSTWRDLAQPFSITCDPRSNSPCFKASWNDIVSGNKVYMTKPSTYPLYLQQVYDNGTNATVDFGTYSNNYYYQPFSTTKVRRARLYNNVNNDYNMSGWQATGEDAGSTASNYVLTDTNMAADIFYNPTASPVSQTVNGCSATGNAITGSQTIQPFSALVVEYGNC